MLKAPARYAAGWPAILSVMAALLVPLQPAASQDRAPPGIRVAPTMSAAAEAEGVLAIEVGPPGTIPAGSFVILRGLPPTVSLKDGHSVGPGRWAVPLSALPSVKAQIPAGVSGQSEIVISLVDTAGKVLTQVHSTLIIQPSPQVATAAASSYQVLSGEERARAERMLERGESYLANGNIMGARDFFERAAEAGLAAAALRLASTFDPAVLRQLKAQGVAPDAALARKWYERAHELGAAEAAAALTRLGRN